jgi:hypothetical protein
LTTVFPVPVILELVPVTESELVTFRVPVPVRVPPFISEKEAMFDVPSAGGVVNSREAVTSRLPSPRTIPAF